MKWKLWATKRHIESNIQNENFTFFAHKWIKNSFPDGILSLIGGGNANSSKNQISDSSYLTEINSKPGLSKIIKIIKIAILNALQVNQAPRYQIINYESSVLYATAVKRRTLLCLIQTPRKLLKFKKIANLRFITRVLNCWNVNSKKNRKIKDKIIKHFREKRRNKLQLTFNILKKSANNKKAKSKKYKEFTRKNINRFIKNFFSGWKIWAIKKINERQIYNQIIKKKRQEIIKASLLKWNKRTKKQVSNNICMQKHNQIAIKGKLKKYWKKWNLNYMKKAELLQKNKKARAKYKKILLNKIISFWQKYSNLVKWKRA